MEEEKKAEKEMMENFVSYEKAFAELFKEIGLKPAESQLVRAFLIVSKGQIEFEASHYDLAKVNNKSDGNDYGRLTENIRNCFGRLQDWQQDNSLTLIEIVNKGARLKDDNGRFEYVKTRYRFVLLAEIANALENNPENVKAVVEATIAKLKEYFVPLAKLPKYRPRHSMKIAKATIFTKLKRAFQLAAEAGDNPIYYCRQILDGCWNLLNDLESEHLISQNRDSFITEFESEMNMESLEDNSEFDTNR